MIDTAFDFRSDSPPGLDPDAHSPTLRRYHQLLWSRPLPDGTTFELRTDVPGAYLLHESELGRFRLSSDTVASSHRKRLPALYEAMPAAENEAFHALGYTIGGSIVFPGNRIGSARTLNQSRGTNRRIEDRIDLTIECIRLNYLGASSPLSSTLALYNEFFALFGTFEDYVRFFLLQDLVNGDGTVRFLHPHDGFDGRALPASVPSYAAYRARVVEFLHARNNRIAGLAL
ncbi:MULTISPECIES: DUF6994 family protein [unclassified Rathayibacter]|uniref:DUF6994 family protein n=1 Tax=unclassified Rathayibacter TaxID=2609250 RepID=UPI0009E8454D|nr:MULTISPECIES: hypothetical protein [unclassified Rathayibacter]